MACEACELETDLLVRVDQVRLRGALPETSCRACGAPMTLDEIDDIYLGFLGDRRPAPTAIAGRITSLGMRPISAA